MSFEEGADAAKEVENLSQSLEVSVMTGHARGSAVSIPAWLACLAGHTQWSLPGAGPNIRPPASVYTGDLREARSFSGGRAWSNDTDALDVLLSHHGRSAWSAEPGRAAGQWAQRPIHATRRFKPPCATPVLRPRRAPRHDNPERRPAHRRPRPQTRRLTIDEAVKLALENNLGIQIARYNPQVEDLTVLQAQAAWAPSFTNTFQRTSTGLAEQQLPGRRPGAKTTDDRVLNTFGVAADAEVGRQLQRRLGRLAARPPTAPSPPSRRSCARRCRSA